MAVLGTIGFLMVFSRAWPIGLVFVLVGGGVLAWAATEGSRQRSQAQRIADTRSRESHEWWLRRPENMVAGAPDPLSAAMAMVAPSGGTAYLGITPDHREPVAAEAQQAVIVLGPPRSGKTSALIVPAILGAPGPVVSTSTKLDVLHATATNRSRSGRIWVFDPSGSEALPPGALELHWTPVTSARTWDGARETADAMVGASTAGKGVENATHWTESAKSVLAPLLHAAALSGRTIQEARRWVSLVELQEAGAVLEAHGADHAADDLSAISNTEERERSSILATTRQVLNAYGSDTVAARSRVQNFDAEAFVRSKDTVYVAAPSHRQHLLAPLVVGLLEEIRRAAYARARGQGAMNAAPVFWALDEIANIAPLEKLPGIVSEAGGQGLQIMACFQDLSQARARWKEAADGFLTLFGTKVVFPGIADHRTLQALSTLVGDWDRPYLAVNRSTGESRQFGLPLGVSIGHQNGIAYSYETRRETLLSPSEIANIPLGNALTVRATRWGLVSATPFFAAQPWKAVVDAAPPSIQYRGNVDVVPTIVGTRAADA
ncbi:hypothetical protein GCM10023201_33410 [Actinomycetospora corticicola]